MESAAAVGGKGLIRLATLSDIDAMVELGRVMHAESPRYRGLPYDAAKVAAQGYAAVGDGVALVATATPLRPLDPEPIIGMACVDFSRYIHSAAVFATDLILFVHPDHRGGRAAVGLVRGMEAIAGQNGAREMLLTVSAGVNNPGVVRFHERQGYAQVGTVLAKTLIEA